MVPTAKTAANGLRRRIVAATLLGALTACLGAAPAAAAEPAWRLEQPPPPPGATLKVPLGPPGDLQFYSPNRGVLAIEGNATIPRGLYTYDGQEWHQLATVCGGPGDTARIAFAGPREFWTVSEPSRPRSGSGVALCHFKDGQVVGSFSTAVESADPYRRMQAAACNGPDDCWFGGVGSDRGPSQPPIDWVGAFHIHWNGSTLQTVYGPQARGVSDLESHGGTVFESTLVGSAPGRNYQPDLAEFESDPLNPSGTGSRPRLLHTIAGGTFQNEPFVTPGTPNGSELLALDSDGRQLWAVGGGAATGPSAPGAGIVPRTPLAAKLDPGGWRELPIDEFPFSPEERFVDVAAVPSTDTAWVAVSPLAQSDTEKAKVARIAADGSATVMSLPEASWGRGSAAKLAFTGPNEGWLVTHAGWLFHYTDGTPLPRDGDPAYAGTITFRPNEAVEQFVPDRPPVDDSELFRPPPIEIEQTPAQQVRRLAPLLRAIKASRRGRTLVVRFRLVRTARIALIARRKGRVVARTRARLMRPGRHVLRLRLNPRRWPQRLSFSAREPGQGGGGGAGGGGDEDVVTTRAANAGAQTGGVRR